MLRPLRWSLVPLLALGLLRAACADDLVHPKGPHLAYRASYGEAMLEARIRNVPVFFTRHKDF